MWGGLTWPPLLLFENILTTSFLQKRAKRYSYIASVRSHKLKQLYFVPNKKVYSFKRFLYGVYIRFLFGPIK